MHSVQISEWILGLVTSRDRAATTVGDLLERDSPVGGVRFWSRISRIAASLLWRQLAENPLPVAGVAAIGLVADVVASLLIAVLSGVLFFFAASNGHQLTSEWWNVGLEVPPLLISVLIGRMLARWAPGRELSACLAYGILGTLFSLLLAFVDPGGLAPSALFWVFLNDVAQRTPVIAGAVWGRHRRLAFR